MFMFFMRRAPTPLLPEDDVPSDLPGLSCPTAPRQKWARRSVKTAVKRRAPTPLLPPSKRSTPAPLVDRWHDGSEEDVSPPSFHSALGGRLELSLISRSHTAPWKFSSCISHPVSFRLCAPTPKHTLPGRLRRVQRGGGRT